MNERIKELCDKVNIIHQIGDQCRMVSDQELEKFSELIVLECAKIADINYNKGFQPVGDFIKAFWN